MFSLAHLSDPHLPLPPGVPRLADLTAKQVLSFIAWRRNRCQVTSSPVLEALAEELNSHAPDHIAITGDLVNLAAGPEVAAAARWLATLGPPEQVSVVPGNHDAMAGAGRLADLAFWTKGDADQQQTFPFLRRRGPVALIGLCSGVRTPLLAAWGRIGTRQLATSAALLDRAGAEGLFRIVLIHHPPVIGAGGRRKALLDSTELADILRRHGAELVLHGHHHRSRLAVLPGPRAPIPVMGVPSVSAGLPRPQYGGWNLHRIGRDGDGWRLTTIARRYDPASRRFLQAGEWAMALGINSAAG